MLRKQALGAFGKSLHPEKLIEEFSEKVLFPDEIRDAGQTMYDTE
ncbi:MAG TPA: hypothetical protein VF857_02865 [Spirochaetota bacterium]